MSCSIVWHVTLTKFYPTDLQRTWDNDKCQWPVSPLKTVAQKHEKNTELSQCCPAQMAITSWPCGLEEPRSRPCSSRWWWGADVPIWTMEWQDKGLLACPSRQTCLYLSMKHMCCDHSSFLDHAGSCIQLRMRFISCVCFPSNLHMMSWSRLWRILLFNLLHHNTKDGRKGCPRCAKKCVHGS